METTTGLREKESVTMFLCDKCGNEFDENQLRDEGNNRHICRPCLIMRDFRFTKTRERNWTCYCRVDKIEAGEAVGVCVNIADDGHRMHITNDDYCGSEDRNDIITELEFDAAFIRAVAQMKGGVK